MKETYRIQQIKFSLPAISVIVWQFVSPLCRLRRIRARFSHPLGGGYRHWFYHCTYGNGGTRGWEWKFLANNGNGERIQIEIAPCGRLLGRGTKLGQTTWMLFSSSRDFFSSQRERAGSQNKAFVKVMSRNSFEQISRSGTMSLLCMFPRLLFLLLFVPVLCAFPSSQRRQSSSGNSIDNVWSAFRHHCKDKVR